MYGYKLIFRPYFNQCETLNTLIEHLECECSGMIEVISSGTTNLKYYSRNISSV